MSEPEPSLDSIPAKHGVAIAVAVMAWADLEFEIDYTIWDLMDSPQALSACLTAQLISPIPKLNALQSLLRLYRFGEELEKQLSEFSGSVASLAQQRNRIVHDKRIWDPNTGRVRRINVTAGGRLKFTEEPETVDDLAKFSERVIKARWKFMEIRKRIIKCRDETRSLPAEQKPQLPRLIRRQTPEAPTSGDKEH